MNSRTFARVCYPVVSKRSLCTMAKFIKLHSVSPPRIKLHSHQRIGVNYCSDFSCAHKLISKLFSRSLISGGTFQIERQFQWRNSNCQSELKTWFLFNFGVFSILVSLLTNSMSEPLICRGGFKLTNWNLQTCIVFCSKENPLHLKANSRLHLHWMRLLALAVYVNYAAVV
jgi:hypothetical protein